MVIIVMAALITLMQWSEPQIGVDKNNDGSNEGSNEDSDELFQGNPEEGSDPRLSPGEGNAPIPP